MEGYVKIDAGMIPDKIKSCEKQIDKCLTEQCKDNFRIVEHFQNIFNNAPKRNKFSLWWNKNVMFKWHREQRNNWTKEEVEQYLIKNFYDDYIDCGFKCHIGDLMVDNFPFESHKNRIQWLQNTIELLKKVDKNNEELYLSIKDYMKL